jgi:hypothetical protein
MAPKRGLGKRFDDIMNTPRGGGSLDRLIPTSTSDDYDDIQDMGDYLLIPRADRTRRQEDIPEDFEALDESEYAPYPVERVTPDTDSSLYGQGPNKSTRVASHKFVPYGRLMNRSMGNQKATSAGIKFGAVYVKFQNNGNVYRYDHVPDHIYQNFRNNPSKGKFINDFLNNYPYAPAATDTNASDL